MSEIFFITGLPRTRTAWLANFFTYGDSYCHHELCRHVPDTQTLGDVLEHDPENSPNVGTADSGFAYYGPALLSRFPRARVAIIERNPSEAAASFRKLMEDWSGKPKLARDLATEAETVFANIARQLEWLKTALADRYSCRVLFQTLGQLDVMRGLWCELLMKTPAEFPLRRWEMLETMRLNIMPEKIVGGIDLAAVQKIFSATPAAGRPREGLTRAQTEYATWCQRLCANTPGAWLWLGQLWDVLLTWDHIHDGDVIDRECARRAFEALVFHWPNNPFFQAHKDKLLVAMVNAYSAWTHANSVGLPSVKQNDAYTEIPVAMAAIIGGLPAVQEFGPKIRQAAAWMHTENIAKDRRKP